MPVRLVVEDAFAEPDDVRHAQVLAQISFDLLATQQRVAIYVEQTLFGHERGAFTVDVDRAALVYDWRAVTLVAFDLEYLTGDEVVLVPRKIQTALQAAPRH